MGMCASRDKPRPNFRHPGCKEMTGLIRTAECKTSGTGRCKVWFDPQDPEFQAWCIYCDSRFDIDHKAEMDGRKHRLHSKRMVHLSEAPECFKLVDQTESVPAAPEQLKAGCELWYYPHKPEIKAWCAFCAEEYIFDHASELAGKPHLVTPRSTRTSTYYGSKFHEVAAAAINDSHVRPPWKKPFKSVGITLEEGKLCPSEWTLEKYCDLYRLPDSLSAVCRMCAGKYSLVGKSYEMNKQ